jgi:hypothetical protein
MHSAAGLVVFRWVSAFRNKKEKSWAYMGARALIDGNVKRAYAVLGFWIVLVEEIPFALWMNECAVMIER